MWARGEISEYHPHYLKEHIDEKSITFPNKYLGHHISISALGEGRHDGKSSELYSHANMIVIGSQGSIIQATGQWAKIKAFYDEASVLHNYIIEYECIYSTATYLLVAKNALHVLSMSNNLTPPFIMKGYELIVD